MKYKIYIVSILAAACSLNIGCVSSVSTAYNNVKSSLESKDSKSEALYNQVPAEDREQVNSLRYELKITEQAHAISQLKSDRDDLQYDRSVADRKRLDLLRQEQQYRVQLARMEAVDRNGLGDRIDNINSITDIHVDAIKVQQKRLSYERDVSVLEIKITELDIAILKQEDKLTHITDKK